MFSPVWSLLPDREALGVVTEVLSLGVVLAGPRILVCWVDRFGISAHSLRSCLGRATLRATTTASRPLRPLTASRCSIDFLANGGRLLGLIDSCIAAAIIVFGSGS